ncbi:hypothetical protein [Mycolicibacterium fortuitum]|uniref:Uncharacterized protein n=3 Tax=Mycolicibacterium fortuitum TaxID=1766 RepID=A0AAE4VF11_MYCFO|nr:hypothetical protein [Mycolicibacterium fortuitum]MDV7227470.1 hypothetical protein [Mycolicibacterium fortuitum]MDV7259832.1 hypothetical protein [Mycolicibacterium fortuitum]MDV7292419.1 hypothetical protein [Mycolicibacterium fortuitum]MDV7299607.1 hypothetical protein [Mycolicibacterium fortuitum]MDV7306825.1 hypothetical protein [Mycolicibacterium fortuitum]
MLITTDTVTEHPKGAGLASILTAGALPSTHAVVLPASRHRHILAIAEWGHLATDGLVTVWDSVAASRLADLTMVRPAVAAWVRASAGAKSMNGRQITGEINRVLLCDMPPYPLLASQPRDSWPRFLAAWTALQPWRAVTPLWAATKILSITSDTT